MQENKLGMNKDEKVEAALVQAFMGLYPVLSSDTAGHNAETLMKGLAAQGYTIVPIEAALVAERDATIAELGVSLTAAQDALEEEGRRHARQLDALEAAIAGQAAVIVALRKLGKLSIW